RSCWLEGVKLSLQIDFHVGWTAEHFEIVVTLLKVQPEILPYRHRVIAHIGFCHAEGESVNPKERLTTAQSRFHDV
ncbi:MAG: hypothetical protein OXT01_28340, partial [Rhodospirillaceae bacterium]|nr:hypothetical protein [Rhodospirillaceae bacterium]